MEPKDIDGRTAIDTIHQRLVRNRMVSDIAGTKLDPKKVLQQRIFGDVPTIIARSEITATEEKLLAIRNNANIIREWVLHNGDPDQVDTNVASKVYEDERWYVSADEEVKGASQSLFLIDKDVQEQTVIEVCIGFNEEYRLAIDYLRDETQPETVSEQYESTTRPIGEMAENEAAIVASVFNGFIDAKKITA